MATGTAPVDSVATLRKMLWDYRITVTDCAEMIGVTRTTVSRILHGHCRPSPLVARHIAQLTEEWERNPPEPSPDRRGGYRGDICAQRAPRKTEL